MEIHELEDFINEAIANGWPSNTVPRTDADFPKFHGGNYLRGPWRCLDVWSGATTDAGMLVVFLEESPVWTCVYRGGLLVGSPYLKQTTVPDNELFDFLITALSSPNSDAFKLRGPSRLDSRDGRWTYRMALQGDVQSFVATEQILERGKLAYERILAGGLVGDGAAYGPKSFDVLR
ncbi:DUF5680 domain-containing protein [Monashia sp. NPDC004114]